MRFLCVFLFSVLLVNANGQSFSLSGVVSSHSSGQAIPYVSICKGTHFQGTITNENGQFSLQNVVFGDTLAFSCIGYKPQKLIVKKETSTILDVLLDDENYSLGEVTVGAFSASGIVDEAKKHVSENYLSQPTRLQGVFRKQITQDGSYVFLGDCLAELNCPTFISSTGDGVFTSKEYFKMRTLGAKVTKNEMDKIFSIEIIPSGILKYIYPESILTASDFFSYKLDRIIQSGTINIYKIHFKGLEKCWKDYALEGNLYVESKNFAVVAFEYETIKDDQQLKTFAVKEMKNYYINLHTNHHYTRVEYKKQQDRWVLASAKISWDFNVKNDERGISHHYVLASDVMINNVFPYSKSFPASQRIDPDRDLFKKVSVETPASFTDFDVIQPDYGQKGIY